MVWLMMFSFILVPTSSTYPGKMLSLIGSSVYSTSFDWSSARLIAPVVTTTSIILSHSKIQTDIPVLAYPGCPGK